MAVRLEDPRSLGDLLGEMSGEIGRLVRDEMQLAKAEMKGSMQKAARSGALFGAGALLGLQAVMLLAFSLAWALDAAMPRGWAFVLAAVVLASVAAFLISRGRSQMSGVNMVPEETVRTMKEDLRWIRTRAS